MPGLQGKAFEEGREAVLWAQSHWKWEENFSLKIIVKFPTLFMFVPDINLIRLTFLQKPTTLFSK